MAEISIPLAGPTYTARSLPVGAQVTKNFYVEVDPSANEPTALMPFPGCKSFAVAGSTGSRGMGTFNGKAYSVSGTELYSVNQDGTSTLIGTIAGTKRIKTVDDGSNLVITNGAGKPYAYDGTTLTQGTDSDLPNANTVAYINDRVIYDRPGGLSFADLDTPLTVNSANVLDTNTRVGDNDCQATITHRQQVYGICRKTTEPSYFTSSGTPPYSRVNNGVQEIGTDSPYSVAYNKDFIYFLGADRNIYQISGVSNRAIGNPAIGQAIQGYSTITDAYAFCFNFDSQFFYLLTFPTEGATWLWNQNADVWTSLGYDVSGGAHLISGYAYIYGKHLVSDRRNGNIYELDFSTYTDNGDTIQRVRTTRTISSKDIGAPGRQLFMSNLKLVIESGVSLVSGAAEIIMEYSDDDGRTWSSERWLSIGEQGDFTYLLEWSNLGSFYKRMFRFTMSDPVKWVLISLDAEVELGIG